jgi:7,8-dihydroneopterin aldolase/epimerase/oxygenase
MKDSVIEIKRLRIVTHIGVPDEERAEEQLLHVTVRLTTSTAFAAMEDEISNTVDYAVLAESIQRLAAERPRRLIETLADEIAALVLTYPIASSAWVRVEKKILPDTDYVAVECFKESRDV